jgi:hypothetical protein
MFKVWNKEPIHSIRSNRSRERRQILNNKYLFTYSDMEYVSLDIGDQVRQGDCFLVYYGEKLPDFNAKEKEELEERKSKVMLEGEATGHNHRATSGQLLMWKKPKGQELGFLKLEEPTEIVHQEHHKLNIGYGVYQIIRQRESTHNQHLNMQFVQD